MITVSLYSYFCLTENVQKVEWLDNGPPTHCRDDPDGSLGHQIEDIFIKDNITNSGVYIQGKAFDPSTGGNFSLKSGSCQVSANPQTLENIQFHIPMSIYGIYIQTGPQHVGDTIDVLYEPQTQVGTVTANINTSDTTYTVDSSTINTVQVGFYLVLTDGTSYFDEIGMITNVNPTNSTISTDAAATKNYVSGTFVAINIYLVRAYPFELPWMHKLGRGVSGSKLMEPGNIIQLRYNNLTGTVKTLTYSYDCIY